MSDIDRYLKLISEVREYYANNGGEVTSGISGDNQFSLEWCHNLINEINLWSFWQNGYRKNGKMNADILLIGQDYGSYIEDGIMIPMIERCLKGIKNTTEEYVEYINDPKKKNDTDRNLIKLFKSLGDDYRADVANSRLFFTNLCLGYRTTEKISGGNVSKYLKHDSIYLKELISILKPKVVICLGAKTYINAIYGLMSKDHIDDSLNKYIKGINKSFNKSLDIMKRDWENISEYLKNYNNL